MISEWIHFNTTEAQKSSLMLLVGTLGFNLKEYGIELRFYSALKKGFVPALTFLCRVLVPLRLKSGINKSFRLGVVLNAGLIACGY